jgi:hypothetical protein
MSLSFLLSSGSGGLGCDLLVGKLRNVGSLAGVFNGDSTDIAVPVKVKDGILVKVFRFHNLHGAKLDIKGVGVLKVLDLHNENDRSKNALCTVHHVYLRPSSNSAVLLNDFLHRVFDHILNPNVLNYSTIRATA